MTDRYLVAGSHPDFLASGRPIAPGDLLAADAVDTADDHDRGLLDHGALVDLRAPKQKAATGSRSGDAPSPAKAGDSPKES